MDRRLEKGKETREKILNTALLIISEEGIKGLSARKIADRSQISKSNIFHHYTSLENLLEVILNGLFADTLTNISLDSCITLEAFFQLLGEMTFKLEGDELTIYKALLSYYNEALFTLKYEKMIVQIKKEVSESFRNQLEKLSGKNIPPDLLETLTADLDGMGLHYMIEKDSDKYMRLWRLKTDMYIQYINNL
ncbi:MAG TPA: TetR/AcrR family transcriptional regulator [Thermotogota bacterium]|nr:TetR/AcrR family transcriptional regulator [Thermotogota bacterium]HPJ89986.1 TetR/AcrR family transcriptional regulator [Thermotogota bacterium]HPR97203.1 TetR/AcrR family transcriptional regulator [Thermotogota bacterium]